MASVPFIADAVKELAGKFSGQLLQPADAGYEEARKVHNGLVNKHPALIARCRGVADVVDAVNLARKLNLEVAIRGGGGNFGVATSFEYQLHPVGPTITGGLIAHPFERARDVLKFARDVTASLPDEFTVAAGLIHAGDGSGAKLAAIVACHCGSLADGEMAMRPLKQFGSPLMDAMGPAPYCQLNGMLDAAYPKGALNYWKSSFLSTLSDDAIDTLVDCFGRCPAPMGQLLLEHFHGAVTRVDVAHTAFPHRAVGYNLVVISEWLEPKDTDRCIAWARETYAAMDRFVAPGRYVNYLGDDETGDPTPAAYGPNYRRLQQIKAKYDPSNFFHMNQNIRPLS